MTSHMTYDIKTIRDTKFNRNSKRPVTKNWPLSQGPWPQMTLDF